MGKNLIQKMKDNIAKSGSSKREILYFGKDAKKRVRFLQELDQGTCLQFHNDWNAGIFELCKDQEDHENCKLCEDGIGLQENFIFSVWDYDSNAVRLMQFKASGVSPIPAFIEMYEEFGTIMDRDYTIKKVGSGTGGSFVVTPLDKERFKNKSAKPFTRDQIIEIMEKAWVSKSDEGAGDDEDEEDDDDEKPAKKGKDKKAKKGGKKNEKSLHDKFLDLDEDDLKGIARELGMTKKEIRSFDDPEDLVDELFDNYEEDDLQDLYDDLDNEDDDDE